MNVSFLCLNSAYVPPQYGDGRIRFSEPKKIQIILPIKETYVCVRDRRCDERVLPLSTLERIRLAIAQFGYTAPRATQAVELDMTLAPCGGTLMPTQWQTPAPAARVRPGKLNKIRALAPTGLNCVWAERKETHESINSTIQIVMSISRAF
jgi:hypothetical protein